MMKSYHIENLFNSETFNELKGFAKTFIDSGSMLYDSVNYNRYYKSIHLPLELQNKVLSEIKNKLSNDKLDIVYIQLIKYQIVDGNIPKLPLHKDRYPSEFFIDLNLETTLTDWGLLVEGTYFADQENSCVVLYGKDDNHFRPVYPSNSENDYCIMMLINLANEGHYSLELKKTMTKEVLEYFENRPVKILQYKSINDQMV